MHQMSRNQFVTALWIILTCAAPSLTNAADQSQGDAGILRENDASTTEPGKNANFDTNWKRAADSIEKNKISQSIEVLKNVPPLERKAISDALLTNAAFVVETDDDRHQFIGDFARLLNASKWASARRLLRSANSKNTALLAEQFRSLADMMMIGGNDAEISEFPWFVGLSIRRPTGAFRCAGAQISKNFVVTAAHCVDAGEGVSDAVPSSNVTVSLNSEMFMGGEILVAKQIYIHDQWEKTATKFDYDIALIEIETVTEGAPPIFLQRNKIETSVSPFWSGGWGLVNERDVSSRLQTGVIGMHEQQECVKQWQENGGKVSDGMLCAGSRNVANCRGDSGAPLLAGQAGKVQLVGIVSWGTKSCSVDGPTAYLPEVYTRISAVEPWLKGFPEIAAKITDEKPGVLFAVTGPAKADR
jgi:V8-like Glu-specific endopeptidase